MIKFAGRAGIRAGFCAGLNASRTRLVQGVQGIRARARARDAWWCA